MPIASGMVAPRTHASPSEVESLRWPPSQADMDTVTAWSTTDGAQRRSPPSPVPLASSTRPHARYIAWALAAGIAGVLVMTPMFLRDSSVAVPPTTVPLPQPDTAPGVSSPTRPTVEGTSAPVRAERTPEASETGPARRSSVVASPATRPEGRDDARERPREAGEDAATTPAPVEASEPVVRPEPPAAMPPVGSVLTGTLAGSATPRLVTPDAVIVPSP
ncbi:MAG TPA: hypothetical protein VMF13_19060, partial [Luteitalea sp.]|nr:hypothetical protein [Luteitalea sp.]